MEDEDSINIGIGTEAEWEGDSYRVTHKGEKFALRPSDMQQASSIANDADIKLAQEEKELAEALEKIRDMETKE